MWWTAPCSRGLRPPRWDAASALVLWAMATALQTWTAAPPGTPSWFAGPQPVALALLAALTLPVAHRRTAPVLSTLVVVVGSALLPGGEEVSWSVLPVTVAALGLLYSVAAVRPPATSVPLTACAVVLDAVVHPAPRPGDAVLGAALTVAVGVAGWSARGRRLAREQRLRAALASERARIVRELNDLVAHQVLGIVLQSAAHRTAPDARAALADIEGAGRESLASMRRLLHVLRRSEDLPTSPSMPRPLRQPTGLRWRPRWSDVTVALSPILLAALTHPLSPMPGDPGLLQVLSAESPSITVPLLVLTAVALLIRRRCPMVTLGAVILTQLAYESAGGDDLAANTAIILAAYSVGAWAAPPVGRTWLRAGGAVALAMVVLVVTSRFGLATGVDRGPVVALMPFAVGSGLAVRGLRGRRHRDRRDADQSAVSGQRALFARDLHDVVAHHVSSIVVLAAAAQLSPELSTSGNAFGDIELSARAALTGLRQLVDAGTDPASLSPQPGLAEVEDLVTAARAAGLRVEARVTVSGSPPLGAEIQLLAYRILQEALTNCVKHAAGARARATVRHSGDVLTVRVDDDGGHGRHTLSRTDPGGYGLVGMRERVHLLGGTLAAGPGTGGGWLVEARIPVGSPARPGRREERWASAS